jgi:hypothetical protein
MLVAGCAKATTDGFSFTPPDGWRDLTDKAEVKTGADYQGVFEGPQGQTLTVDDAEPPDPVALEAAVVLARRTLDQQFGGRGRLEDPEPARLDGERALRFEGTGDGRTVGMLLAVHAGKTWTVTLNAREDRYDAAVLDRAIESWSWD